MYNVQCKLYSSHGRFSISFLALVSYCLIYGYYNYSLTTVSYLASFVTVNTVTIVTTVTSVTTVSNFVGIQKHSFVISEYLQFLSGFCYGFSLSFWKFLTQFLEVSYSVCGSFSLTSWHLLAQFLPVSHSVFGSFS